MVVRQFRSGDRTSLITMMRPLALSVSSRFQPKSSTMVISLAYHQDLTSLIEPCLSVSHLTVNSNQETISLSGIIMTPK
jgi:hypothetical protein